MIFQWHTTEYRCFEAVGPKDELSSLTFPHDTLAFSRIREEYAFPLEETKSLNEQ